MKKFPSQPAGMSNSNSLSAVSALFLKGSTVLAILVSGCASQQEGKPAGNQIHKYSSDSALDSIPDPYHYPGTAIPGGSGQGGSGGIPDIDTATPPPMPDSIGNSEFNDRG